MSAKPLIALAMGDGAGIGAELAVKVLSEQKIRDLADFLILGDRRAWQAGERVAGLTVNVVDWNPAKGQMPAFNGPVFVDLAHAVMEEIVFGEATVASGAFAQRNFATALRLANAGCADAVCFTPFNKFAMRLAEPAFVDEIGFIQRTLDCATEGREFNVLDEVWNARVTSHVPLSEVAGLLSRERVRDSLLLTERTMRGAGFARPRIAVAALNPHAGDNGNFGREEIDILEPVIAEAQQQQLDVTGPVPADTVYVRAVKGEFDAVLTMYHDQGQIAMKLLGFDRGVTLIGGFPFWITTPAHGTAYDIAGKGIANANATARAIELAVNLACLDNPNGFPDLATRYSGDSALFCGESPQKSALSPE